MSDQFLFATEVFINGLMAGVLYALVALGFVLIYKASGIFNYAQGVMALFAAMTLVGIMEGQVPFSHIINAIFGTEVHHFGWHVPALLAILLTVGVMVGFAWLVQRVGRKRVWLASPLEPALLDTGIGVFNSVDPRDPPEGDLAEVHWWETVIEPGDAVFLPAGWWHQVLAETPSVSVSLGGFRWRNNVKWYTPAR